MESREKRVKEDEVLKKIVVKIRSRQFHIVSGNGKKKIMLLLMTEQNLEEVVDARYSAGSSGYDKQHSRHCLGNYISYTEGIMAGSPRREIRPKIAPRKSRHINSANSWPMQS